MDDPIYVDAKDFRDINTNFKLLVQKFNHENSNMTKSMQNVEKKMDDQGKIIDKLGDRFEAHETSNKTLKNLLKTILGIMAAFGGVAGLGAAFG